MYTSRSAARASRVLRAQKQQLRSQSSSAPPPAAGGALAGGLAGGAAAFALGYGWYHFSGTKKVVNSAKDAQAYMQETSQQFKKQFQEKAPNPNEALRWLRQVSTYYAGFLPGASGLVNTTFDDLEKIREKHGDEVDKIVSEAYEELRGVSQKSMSLQTAQQAWNILQKHLQRIGELAGDAFEDILDNHPKLKQQVGGNIDKLKQYGEQYGPEAEKLYEDTKKQIQDITKSGFSSETIQKIRKLVEEKVQELQKFGDQAWKKGMEQLGDKNPKVKEILEKNADALKQGNISELFEKAKAAVSEGKTEDLEKYVQQAKDKAQQSFGGGFESYLKMVPGGDEIQSKMQQLQELAKSKGPEAQKLLEKTVSDIKDVLSKRSEEAKKLADEAKKE